MSFNRSGYIGRAPGDSSVTIARKSYEPTGVQTDFTFSAGYDPGYCDVYLNGIRLVKDNDFTASDGSTVGLTSAAQNGDIVEIVAYKAFNLGQSITDITGDLTITDTLTATNVSGTTSVTAGTFYGNGSGLTGVASTDYIITGTAATFNSQVKVLNLNVTGITTTSSFNVGSATTIDGGGINVTGVITATSFSGDGTNITGVVGVGTLNVRTESLTVSGVSTLTGVANFASAVNVDATTDSTSTTTGALIVDGGLGVAKNVYIGAGLSVAGTLTYEDVTSVDSVGMVTAKSGVNVTGGQLQVGVAYSVGAAGVATAAGFVGGTISGTTGTFTGDIDIADKIVHTGDTNTALRFPSADTFTVETAGTERLRIADDGELTSTATQADVATFTSNQSASTIYVKDTDGDGIFISGSSAYGHRIYTNTTEDLLLGTNSEENFRIKSGGNVGINTNNPNHELTVFGDEVNFRLTHDGSTNKYNALYLNVNGTGAEVNSYQDGTGTKRPLIVKQYDTERLRIDASGNLKIGNTSDRDLGGLSVQRLHIEGTDGGSSAIGLVNNQNSTGQAAIYFSKSRGTSVNSNTVLQSGDPMGALVFCGSDGSDMVSVGAEIRTEVDGTPGSNDMPGRIVFKTTADGAATATERLRIDKEGGFIFSNGALLEKVNITAGKLSDNTNIDLDDGMVHYFTTQESTTSTPNIRVNSSTSLNDIMTAGDIVTVTLVTTAASGGYSANVTIDGNAVTEEWVGGSAPSGGGSDGLDIYVYTIICTHASNTGDSGFKVIANLTNAT